MNRKYVILLLLAAFGLNLKAFAGCCGPLYRRFSATAYAGVDPALFSDVGNLYAVLPTATVTDPFNELSKNRAFSEIFKNPGVSVGVNFSYNLCSCVELFGEFQYVNHGGRKKPFTITFLGNDTQITTPLDSFNAYSGYIGIRYFFDRICRSRLAFFLGSKFGIRHYNEVQARPFNLIVTATDVNFSQNVTWFNSANTVGGGLQVGFDFFIYKCTSFFFNAEVVASCPFNANTIITLNDPTQVLGITNLVRENDGVFVSFPINFGVRYYFG